MANNGRRAHLPTAHAKRRRSAFAREDGYEEEATIADESTTNALEGAAPVSPFSIGIFRRFLFANVTASFGALIQAVGAAWLMTSLSKLPTMVTLVQSSTTLPMMLLALMGGAIADNFNRRGVMLAAQAFMLFSSIGLVICAYSGLLTPWLLLTFTFLIGCGVAINAPSLSASIGDMVPRTSLPAALSLSSTGFNIARSVGPALGGIIVASAGAAAAFVINALSYLGLIGVLLRWRPAGPSKALPRETIGAGMRGGLRYVAMSPHLRRVILRSACFGIFASGASALMPLIARDVIKGSAGLYGILSAAFGFGAVMGAILTGRLRHRFSSETIVRFAAIALAGGTAVASFSVSAPLTMAAMIVSGSGWVLGLSTLNILVQLASPRWVVGRALACYQMAAYGAMAVGSWLIGEITAEIGVPHTLLVIAGFQASNLVLSVLLPLAEAGELNLNPQSQFYEPSTCVPVSPRSGPLVIVTHYRIAEEDVPAFQAAMIERRRIRRRDGASGWALLRDLGDPERWIERYELPTWADYIRHNHRHTLDDAKSWDLLKTLHQGPGLPVITRYLERQPSPPRPDAVAEAITDPNIV